MCTLNKTPFFVIAVRIPKYENVKHYLAWQELPWDENGYFWASRQVLADILAKNPEFNAPLHQFAFSYPEVARRMMRLLRDKGIDMPDAKIEKIYI